VWVGLAFVLGCLAWYKSLNLVLVLAYGMTALLILNGLLAWLQVRRVEVVPLPYSPVHAREATRVGVRVRNSGTRPTTAGVSNPPGDWFLDRFPPAADVNCSALRSFPTRGRYTPASPTVWSAFPFGLVRFEREAMTPHTDGGASELVVLPEPGMADAEGLRRWILRQVGGEGRARKVLRRIATDQADVRGVRPYRPGDSIRWVHWRSSARRRQLLVREYDSAPSPDLVVVVEAWLPAHPTTTERLDLEDALSLAVTVVESWARAFGTRVTLAVAGDGSPDVRSTSAGDEVVRTTLVPLADVTGVAAPVAPGSGAFDRSVWRSARVLVTPRPNSPLADELAHSVGRPFVVITPRSPLPWYQPPLHSPVEGGGLTEKAR
jgi:uncharacterized protein (DUF58 family)